ncbi:substrate-binding periplasmic protein [Inhella gelatinilytica]|uniref:Transporter substrate-binding domain-containing protein n=1 Tax=Inhella gelatinilytica TaxID=2795030 RepID=A0A931IW55_9BURK|nr:transporter substrate-binding domain-containing protein [Inhella gelatinilytica]MBH9553032.1 transporter substrate-binding domain-containing protein [Inhella gelatinilytica]
MEFQPSCPGQSAQRSRAQGRLWVGVLAAWLGTSAGVWADPPGAETASVGVCFDEADHTPYLYRDSEQQWRGAALDLTRLALERAGYTVRWLPMPWVRCVREVESFGSRGQAEVLLYASLNAEREAQFLSTRPLHRVQGGLWYSRRYWPRPPALSNMKGLFSSRLCGMHGHNYAWLAEFGITRVDSGARDLRAAVEKLERGRCDFVLSALEPVRGAGQLGFVSLPDELAFIPYPGRGPVNQHVLITRQSGRSAELHQRLNQALAELQQNGVAEQTYRVYLPDGTGLKP